MELFIVQDSMRILFLFKTRRPCQSLLFTAVAVLQVAAPVAGFASLIPPTSDWGPVVLSAGVCSCEKLYRKCVKREIVHRYRLGSRKNKHF